MSSEASLEFEKTRNALQIEIEANNNLSDVIRKLNALHKYLIDISSDLPAYEKEKYGLDITMLVQQIADKERLREQVKPKRIQFKGRTKSHDPVKEPSPEIPFPEDELKPNDIIVGADIALKEPTCSFVDLSLCKVTCGSTPATRTKNGSLSFHRIAETVINLQSLPFQDGSIFISECQDSIIICKVPADAHLQIRLHNLKNCKLIFASQNTQNVILEGCENCLFHSSTEPYIVIQDFTYLNLDKESTESSKSYQFQDFDSMNMDTNALKERYINS